MTIEIDQDSQTFLKNLLSGLAVNPSEKDALKTVVIVQSLFTQLNAPPAGEVPQKTKD